MSTAHANAIVFNEIRIPQIMSRHIREEKRRTTGVPPIGKFFGGNSSSTAKKSVQKKDKEKAGPVSTTDIDTALKAQKKLWDDINAHFPNDGHKLAGSGYRASGSAVKADFTEGMVGKVSHSAPVVYVSKTYMDEADVETRKAWIRAEIRKIDQWRVVTGRIDNQDIGNSYVEAQIDKLDVPGKMKVLEEMAKRTWISNADMIKHIRRKMPSTPWISGATATVAGGFEFQFENVKIIVNPDVFNSSHISSGAHTEIDPAGTANFNIPAYGWDGSGVINRIDFTPVTPQIVYHITTHYSASSDPTHTSGYGVGTRAGDSGDQKSLRFHEGMHGRVFIEHIKNNIASNKYPVWKGAIGQSRTDFENHRANFATGITAFRDMLSAAMAESVQKVDCVGKTIEQYHHEKGTTSSVTCAP